MMRLGTAGEAVYREDVYKRQHEGNTAQRASGDFARHLLANFPSYFTKMLVNTASCLLYTSRCV